MNIDILKELLLLEEYFKNEKRYDFAFSLKDSECMCENKTDCECVNEPYYMIRRNMDCVSNSNVLFNFVLYNQNKISISKNKDLYFFMFDKINNDEEIALFEIRGRTKKEKEKEKGKREPKKYIQWLFSKKEGIRYDAIQFDILDFKMPTLNSIYIRHNYMMYGTNTFQSDF